MDSKTSAAFAKTEVFPPHRVFCFFSLANVRCCFYSLAFDFIAACDPIWVTVSLQLLGVSCSSAPRLFFLPSASAR